MNTPILSDFAHLCRSAFARQRFMERHVLMPFVLPRAWFRHHGPYPLGAESTRQRYIREQSERRYVARMGHPVPLPQCGELGQFQGVRIINSNLSEADLEELKRPDGIVLVADNEPPVQFYGPGLRFDRKNFGVIAITAHPTWIGVDYGRDEVAT